MKTNTAVPERSHLFVILPPLVAEPAIDFGGWKPHAGGNLFLLFFGGIRYLGIIIVQILKLLLRKIGHTSYPECGEKFRLRERSERRK